MNALELHNVELRYPDFTLGPLDLVVPGGTVCGLIGENGAGKSTTMRLILQMLEPDKGSIRVLGQDTRTMAACKREDVGVVLRRIVFTVDPKAFLISTKAHDAFGEGFKDYH